MDVSTTARVIYLALADYEAIPEAERPSRKAFVAERFADSFLGYDDDFAAACFLRDEGRFERSRGLSHTELRWAIDHWYREWVALIGPENMTF
ncbi:hypothetical protein [Ruegeria sp. HKCCD6604]|uniref:hypothetical protein n=1 Tax=Ruegeria sp. HKCCD6604 TaxID=2683000 RepID=UPI001491EBB1|nr:hypothetical protein [Ruegeria sp. HKCCD6604]NOC91570.1 hypothetical protein [Ruegeria sp. HKCCD6604]